MTAEDKGKAEFMGELHRPILDETARTAAKTLAMELADGIPIMGVNVMDTRYQEHVAGVPCGSYPEQPEQVNKRFYQKIGVSLCDQYIPRNPLSMDAHGYREDTPRTVTTGEATVMLDGMMIDSPEATVEHMERYVFPRLEKEIESVKKADRIAAARILVEREYALQHFLAPEVLKVPYGEGYNHFPSFRYGIYGYINYFTAFVMYPEIMERDFRLQADLAVELNRIAALSFQMGDLPRVLRLDHDMADSRSTLVDICLLDRLWFPHFARAIQPYLDAEIRLLWHCDGNLMEMVPRLIACGVGGFQGFQYEDGMNYERICRMTTRDGEPLMIWAGVSVTRTLPYGTPEEVRREMMWLVECAPPVGFVLGASSSVVPGVPWENLDALVEGFRYFRTYKR